MLKRRDETACRADGRGAGDGAGHGAGREAERRRALAFAGVALRRYGLEGAGVRPVGRPGFKDVFRVSAGGLGDYVLRMYDAPSEAAARDAALRTGAGLRDPEVLRSQLVWLSRLREGTRLLLPEPVPLPDGALVGYASPRDLSERGLLGRIRLALSGDPGRHFVLLRWMDGEQKAAGDLTPQDLARLGAYTATLHLRSEAGSHDGLKLPRWDWRHAFGEGARIWSAGPSFYAPQEMRAFEAVSGRVRESLDALGQDRRAFGPIHRDLQPSNLLFRDVEVGAIDFDLCGLGHHVFDLAVTLLSLKARLGHRAAPLQNALLRGYAETRTLPTGLEGGLKAFTAVLTVSSVNRSLSLLGTDDSARGARGRRFLENAAKRLGNYDAAMSPLAPGAGPP